MPSLATLTIVLSPRVPDIVEAVLISHSKVISPATCSVALESTWGLESCLAPLTPLEVCEARLDVPLLRL